MQLFGHTNFKMLKQKMYFLAKKILKNLMLRG